MPDPLTRFPPPETARLSISEGDYLVVRRRLTAGEQRAAYARMYVPGPDGTPRVNPLMMGVAMVAAYLVDWSLTDDGAPVSLRGLSVDAIMAELDRLDVESFAEIREAVDAHESAMLAERAQEKKLRGSSSGDAVTSPSPSAAAGALSGSVN